MYLHTHNMDGVFLIRNGLLTNKYCQKKTQYDTPAKTNTRRFLNNSQTYEKKPMRSLKFNYTNNEIFATKTDNEMQSTHNDKDAFILFDQINFRLNCITFHVDLKSNEEKPHKTCYMNNLFAF